MSIKDLSMFQKDKFKSNTKDLFALTIPVFIELLLNNLLGTIDTIMIGNYDPTGGLVAATANAGFILNFLVMLFTVASVGVGIVVSQYIGAKKENTDKVLSQGIILNLIISLVITILFALLSKQILIALNTPTDILEECNIYLFIISFSLPAQALVRVLSANIKSYGKPLYISIIYLVCNGINVLLNYILIFGKLGLPALGIKGAAIATLTCHILIFVLCVIMTKIKIKQRIFSLKIDKEIMKKIVVIGLPSALEMICYNAAQLIMIAQVNKLSTPVATARGYVFLFQTYIYMFSSCIGTSNAILVGYAVGRKDHQNARDTTGLASLYSFPIILIIISLINILGFLIFPLFNKEPQVLENIYKVLPLLFLVELSRCANLIYINALKSSGDTIFPVVVGVIFMFLCAALGSYIFGIVCNLGLVGVYLALGLDELFRAILCYIRWKKGKWTKYEVDKKKQ